MKDTSNMNPIHDQRKRDFKRFALVERPQNKVLLHSCCAPCSGDVMEAIRASDTNFMIFFYNPNIYPIEEYELRKNKNIRFAEQFGVPFVDADYDRDNWFSRAKGMPRVWRTSPSAVSIAPCASTYASNAPRFTRMSMAFQSSPVHSAFRGRQ